ncbi:FtsX-like permease family protein [Nocardioides aquiterrae]|uniref:ABC3 transporter permease C-terminal domain-containing protein n=1 Tax=Nocardioides aquiterrae TaxID=203799 RepID=A0ABN1UPZ3_9ACTN
MSRLTGWRLALRMARREALRAKGRSVLVLVMIALPVLAVTAADVVLQTQDVSSVEGLDRRLGSAAAQVVVPAEGRPMIQAFDPEQGSSTHGRKQDPPTAADISAVLGGARLVEERVGGVDVRTDKGSAWAQTTQVDLRDPIAAGLAELTSGRLPDRPEEVVVNQALLDKGYAVGDRLELRGRDAPSPVIVGVAESPEARDYPFAAGPVGSLDVAGGYSAGRTWMAGGGPVSWETVTKLNAMGATVLSRAVIEDPPPPSEIPEEIRAWSSGTDDAFLAAVALIVVMALLEVVLLAGPAFAVSARRQSRSLALMAASGGTPAQSRRVVLAGGVVLGGAAAALGVGLGIGAGWLLVPLVQRMSSTWFGPFDVPWLHLAGVAAFGLASAVLAAVVPAWIASRQDVVAVLAGRRADRPPSVRSPILGLVLLGAGVAAAAYGASASQNGEVLIAGAAILAVLGMIFVVPVVVAGVARLAGRLPLSPRYAARDAARHRTRTVPAVAAVAATVAGVVALGIAVTSDEAENRDTYTPTLAMGQAAVTGYGLSPARWTELEEAVRREAPHADVAPIAGVIERGRNRVELTAPGHHGALVDSTTVNFGSSTLVADSVPAAVPGLSAADRERADAVLARGGVVAFADDRMDGDAAVVTRGTERATLPAAYVHFEAGPDAPLAAVLSPAAVDRVGAEAGTVALAVSGAELSAAQRENVSEAVAGVTTNAGFYVERGYQADQGTVIVQLVLAALGAVLMLGGTLTATFLALSDARPDLATLSAVGASPRRRRWIAASYALVVGFVGSVLGAAVGFIPGLAVAVPLTSSAYSDTGPYLDVPWLLVVGLVLGLPLVTALVVGAATRSRLPLVARLD